MNTVISLLLAWLLIGSAYAEKDVELPKSAKETGVMLLSTIDGALTAIDSTSGTIKWSIKEGPILESPITTQQGFTFIPDPSDGQLYLVVEGHLTKLPFTIPQLVKLSPCRSTDGILYAGNKKDIWIAINPETGQKSETLSSPASSFCPVSDPMSVFIGKTEYHISMLDTKKRDRQWNTTFVDYSSHLLPVDTQYPFKHFTSSTDGSVMTVDARTNTVLWNRKFDSTIVNMYLLKKDGMHKLPSIVMGQETFEALIENTSVQRWNDILPHTAQQENTSSEQNKKMQYTLFVGQTPTSGLYALSAVVDEKTAIIAPKSIGAPLIEGPTDALSIVDYAQKNNLRANNKPFDKAELLLGYHEPPPTLSTPTMMPTTELSFSHRPHSLIDYARDNGGDDSLGQCIGGRCGKRRANVKAVKRILTTPSNDSWTKSDEISIGTIIQLTWQNHPHALVVTITTLLFVVFWAIWTHGRNNALMMQANRQYSFSNPEGSSHRSTGSNGSRGSSWDMLKLFGGSKEAESIIKDGWETVGKISLNHNELIGHGCEGTIVLRGTFDGREVAVKRVLKNQFHLSEREVKHLRESDSHVNVIRYFSSEANDNFHFIALELCEGTLECYVKIEEFREKFASLNELDLLRQASEGIAHLHSINIVHRDVKPRNILLAHNSASKSNEGKVRVLISDFGLCKKIQLGQNSLSKMSGVAGTEGWMAPEVLLNDSVTRAVDVFSLGCIFYYVLSGGDHPFGDSLRRQDNILHGEYNLQKLTDNSDFLGLSLIEAMLDGKASRRPVAKAAAMHPLFWSKERQLQFLMDVSDRIEKEDDSATVVKRLERNSRIVVNGDWRRHLSRPLQEDLLKHRTYKGTSVRDLLRAMRNKKHHYMELSEELRQSLGSIPNEFLTYFTSKFPKLLIHIYTSLTVCAEESVFATYYTAELKTFYERVLLEQLEYDYVHPAMRSSPQRFGASAPGFPPQVGAVQKQSPLSYLNATPLATESVPVLKLAASEDNDWRAGLSPSDPLLLASDIKAGRSPQPSKKNGKTKKKKSKAPFSALRELSDEAEQNKPAEVEFTLDGEISD